MTHHEKTRKRRRKLADFPRISAQFAELHGVGLVFDPMNGDSPAPADQKTMSAYLAIERVFPEARAVWYRAPGSGWRRNG